MDEKLIEKMRNLRTQNAGGTAIAEVELTYTGLSEEINVVCGELQESHQLKPLPELYKKNDDTVTKAVDIAEKEFMPLLMRIEETIIEFDKQTQWLTDAQVALGLQALSMSPDQPQTEPLAKSIQHELRILLSVNEYSRQEVRQALRKITKSVARHENGQRGYIKFVQQFLKV